MAIATIHTYLMQFPDTVTSMPTSSDVPKATKVIDITNFPDLGGDPEKIDVTTLSDEVQKNINGIQKMDSMKFEANYELADFKTVQALKGKKAWYAVFFGADSNGKPDGHNGIIAWKGEISSYVKSGKTNEAIGIQLTSSCETAPTLVSAA